ncbi:putative toxin-antitoxin system toxin component, PIN family [Noviherbaspirillum massiliense]|uniref:putative toxin-antitoxin system toxin component, PIN family n=1 Tax=Noviherbaspirillum massiliense TaxID=1465823 RepID=UPI0003648424|nr:putative toxin-antitoxin system toxin component, PIN family [Noviherbaspirillum massiliense]
MIPKRVVLDTNVCLDLFVFRDPRWIGLLTALKEGKVEAVTREDCRMEWLAVLEYPHLPLSSETRPLAAAEFDALISLHRASETDARTTVPLPICRDPDDQKFLELARDSAAQLLITKDKALLKLAKRTAKAGLFAIITPEAWKPEE